MCVCVGCACFVLFVLYTHAGVTFTKSKKKKTNEVVNSCMYLRWCYLILSMHKIQPSQYILFIYSHLKGDSAHWVQQNSKLIATKFFSIPHALNIIVYLIRFIKFLIVNSHDIELHLRNSSGWCFPAVSNANKVSTSSEKIHREKVSIWKERKKNLVE